MAVVEGLISTGEDGSLRFGNYKLDTKSKMSGYEHFGDSYKVKTFKEITKLECNDSFVYESVPGTFVSDFSVSETKVEFNVEGFSDTQIALGLEPEQEYHVYAITVGSTGTANDGSAKTNLGGKLIFSVELGEGAKHIKVVRV